MDIVGYADPLSVRPGETVRFMISSVAEGTYRADVVRIINGDTNPAGPGFKEELIDTALNGTYPARQQAIYTGSYVRVSDHPLISGLSSFHVQAMIWPTTPAKGAQGLVTKWSDGRGFALMIGEDGCLALKLGDAARAIQTVSTGTALEAHEWYLVVASYDAGTKTVVLVQKPLCQYPLLDAARVHVASEVTPALANGAPLMMAAWYAGRDGTRLVSAGHFNGKIDRPLLASRVLSDAAVEALNQNVGLGPTTGATSAAVAACAADVVAVWDFSKEMMTPRVVDISPNRLHGETVHLPTRAMKGHNWNGSEMNWARAPDQYGAIHFHDDDLYDTGWEVDFELVVPQNLRSGFYSVRLQMDGEEDYVPFFVLPPRKQSRAKLAFLAPTASYMAYANERLLHSDPAFESLGRLPVLGQHDLYLRDHPELASSLYDHHSDGSGVSYSSRLRPIVNMRPKYQFWGGPPPSSLHQYNADTHIIDWLEARGHVYDVITDEVLHHEGLALLSQYTVVVTGSHPEYHSKAMLDALQAFTDRGGRLVYLGGNGFYWRIAFHDTLPGVIEVRRAEGGIRTWIAEPGEYYHSFTGEYGGLWLRQGRPPQRICGIGFTSQGFDRSSYYRRLPDSFNDRAAFIFAGVGDHERIGDFGLVGDGAAGFELDRADRALGTPPHALVLASSEGHSDTYLRVLEDLHVTGANITGTTSPLVRADMVFYETPDGGAVFSTGSIAWAGSLSHRNYENNVSRIVDNVVRRFLVDTPF